MGDLLGEGAGVGEDDRGAVLVDDPPQASHQPSIAQAAVGRLSGLDQALDRELVRRRVGGWGSLDDAAAPRRSDQEPRESLVRPAGRRQPHAAGVANNLRRQSLERDGQAIACAGDGPSGTAPSNQARTGSENSPVALSPQSVLAEHPPPDPSIPPSRGVLTSLSSLVVVPRPGMILWPERSAPVIVAGI